MPELPELYTSALLLSSYFNGYILDGIDHHTGKCLKGTELYQFFVSGYTIITITNRGKKLIIGLSNNHYLMFSYLMEGRLLTYRCDRLSNHLHFTLRLRHPSTYDRYELYYYDSRRMGGLQYFISLHQLQAVLSNLGPDLIHDNVTPEQWLSIMRGIRSAKSIAEILLQQERVAGIGNYLRCDILYYARIHPLETLSTLTNEELIRIYNSTMLILRESVSKNGASVFSYTMPNGQLGTYSPLVYSRQYDQFNNIVERIKLNGRTVHYCPAVQLLKSSQYLQYS